MARSVTDFGQGSTAGQGVRDEAVETLVDRQLALPVRAEQTGGNDESMPRVAATQLFSRRHVDLCLGRFNDGLIHRQGQLWENHHVDSISSKLHADLLIRYRFPGFVDMTYSTFHDWQRMWNVVPDRWSNKRVFV